ncbi:MAG: hypothetical protein OIF56_01260 [Cohaesibacter sp.]|nr:hypothetical protein [Cohaesibacter sp.]MCV6601547.1 hypothetical protein [Cohaesibacter sp.]
MQEARSVPEEAVLKASNINPATLLATDYLNHFNEVLMLIEMLPSMPDCAEDVFCWQEMSYCDYFQQSTFKGKDLAIAIYDQVEPDLRDRFESLIGKINEKVGRLIEAIAALNGDINQSNFEPIAFMATTEIRPLIDQASALINGSQSGTDWMLAVDHPTAQDEIDRLFD